MKSREPQPIVLPVSTKRRLAASAITVRDLPLHHALPICKYCSSPIELGAYYCGYCGTQLRETFVR